MKEYLTMNRKNVKIWLNERIGLYRQGLKVILIWLKMVWILCKPRTKFNGLSLPAVI
jgi:hypothetical protein